MIDTRLLSLLHLCDSLFPTGAYAHSDGLEAAASSGFVATSEDLSHWLDACLHDSIAACEGIAVMLAVQSVIDRRWDDLADLDADLHALRPSLSARRASRGMGRRLLRTWHATYPQSGQVLSDATGGSLEATLPVAFAVVCGSIGIEPRPAVEAFAYTRLATTASCAMRLLPVGQHEAHARLAAALARVPGAVDDIERRVRQGHRPGAFTPAMDLAVMSHQYVASRLFLS
jgi:urease accessory protein